MLLSELTKSNSRTWNEDKRADPLRATAWSLLSALEFITNDVSRNLDLTALPDPADQFYQPQRTVPNQLARHELGRERHAADRLL
jgi:hypothetical protein